MEQECVLIFFQHSVYGKIIFPNVIGLQITCLALILLLSHNLFVSIHYKNFYICTRKNLEVS